MRFYLGGQWFAGKDSEIPFVTAIIANIDFQNGNIPSTVAQVSMLVEPISVFSFRLQTGLGF